jgi:hypothetical protein
MIFTYSRRVIFYQKSGLKVFKNNMLGLIFLEAMGMYYFENNMNITDNAGKNIFEACLKTIPPLITLVLGYYFGKKSS